MLKVLNLALFLVILAIVPAFSAEDVVVATVNGEKIMASQLDANFKEAKAHGQPMTDKALKALTLTQMIDNMLVLQAAKSADVQNTAQYKELLAQANERIMQEVFLQQQTMKRLSDDDLQKQYKEFLEEQKDMKEVWARHILVQDKSKAEELIKELEKGEDFVTLAANFSIDKTAKTGGDLGYFTRGVMIPEFEYAAFGLDKGQYTHEPVQTRFGWHIIKVEDIRSMPKPSFQDIKPILVARATKNLLGDILKDLRAKSTIDTADQ